MFNRYSTVYTHTSLSPYPLPIIPAPLAFFPSLTVALEISASRYRSWRALLLSSESNRFIS